MCSRILSSWENGIPLNKSFTPGGRKRPKRKHVLQRVESHRCEANTLGTFACNFSTFFKGEFRDNFDFRRLEALRGPEFIFEISFAKFATVFL